MSTQAVVTDSSESSPESDKTKRLKCQSKKDTVAFPLLYGILACAVIYAMTSGGMGVSYDSERYLISAEHLRHLETEPAFQMVSPTFPILYPLAVTEVQWLGLGDGTGAARIISILAFIISVVTIFRLGLLIQGRVTAHLSSISLLVLAPLLYVFSYCWSETLYLPLSLLFLLTLVRYHQTAGNKSLIYLISCGFLAGLGLVTRYIGVSMILTGFLAVLLLPRTERVSKKIREIVSFGCAAGLPVLLYLIGCFVYLNRVFRASVPSRLSLLQQTGHFFMTIYHDLLTFYLTFDQNIELIFDPNLQAGLVRFLLISQILIGLCVLVGGFVLVKTLFSSRSFRVLLRLQAGILGYVVIYSLLIVCITARVAVDRMGTRFAAPIYPLLLVLTFAIIACLYQTLDKLRLKRLWMGITTLAVGLFWAIQITSGYNIYQSVHLGSFPSMEQPGNLNRQSLKFLQDNTGPDDIVISNIPYKLNLIWPRPLPYLGITIKKEAGATGMAINDIPDSLSFLWPWEIKGRNINPDSLQHSWNDTPDPLHHRSVYIIFCPRDFSHYSTPIETFEELNLKKGFASQRRSFGNDLIYRTETWVFNSPREKEDALKERLANIQPGGNHQ